MSDLSLADMRRIGAQRNQGRSPSKPNRKGLLAGLPFLGGDKGSSAAATKAASPVSRLSGGAGVPMAESADASPLAGAQDSALAVPHDTITRAKVCKPLQQNAIRHSSAGGAAGAMVGLAVAGMPVALPIGALAGAAVGHAVGKRAQHIPSDTAKSVTLKPKQAPALFHAARSACGLVECSEGALTIVVDQSAGVRAVAVGRSRGSTPKGYQLTVGLAVLTGLAVRQIEALCAHALVCAKLTEETDAVDQETVQRLDSLETSLAKRSAPLRLARLGTISTARNQARRAFHAAWEARSRQADRLTARYAGPRALVEALLAQALLAARFWQDAANGRSYAQGLAALKDGYGRSDLDNALHCVAEERQPSADAAQMGFPVMTLERIASLDTACSVPIIPAMDPAFEGLPQPTQTLLEKRLAAPDKAAKTQQFEDRDPVAAKPAGKPRAEKKPKVRKEKTTKAQAKSGGLFSGLISRGRAAKGGLPDHDPHLEPLYHADALFKSDPALGLEAYQALVDANPRWALARLRMAEAQIEMGIPDCVANLMTCADRLPSALPTILDRLQSALAMVSPLEEEPLRQAVIKLQNDAAAVAQERAEIDLEKLSDCTLDAQDRETLSSLFNHSPGLREVWVLGAPCVYMPEVPHHAILGLAPRMSADDAHVLAMTLAEHAAVSGTVAVHIETGTPRGALGDTLATYPSLWRASRG
jgi:hypothetical protein